MAYNAYGQNWMNQPVYPNNPQMSYANQPQPQPQMLSLGLIWVDGEVGAKAFQIPPGHPVGTPIALWDTNEKIIYLKSVNQMGMPNPLQKLRYNMEEPQAGYLQSGAVAPVVEQVHDAYATKDDLEAMKKEIVDLLKANQNGSQNNVNRGGNR